MSDGRATSNRVRRILHWLGPWSGHEVGSGLVCGLILAIVFFGMVEMTR